MNLRRFVPSFGLTRSRVCNAFPEADVCAPFVLAFRMSLMYREVWCMQRNVAALTFCRSWCDGRVKACILSRSSSGMVHHGGRRVACLGPVESASGGVVGLAVYMTQKGGRGAIAPMSTRNV